ncbi:MAG: TolC family protein [Chitinophagaceae bacterium]|nr:MAG: TolC family protein [Chitinophagaceae bacterium]
MKKNSFRGMVVLTLLLTGDAASAQVLTMEEALQTAVANYPTLRAKQNYKAAAAANEMFSRRDALPNLTVTAQQDYGTINGQNGPLYGFGGYGVASSGLPLPSQNWNSAFGALYLANISWDFFAFGRVRERIKAAHAATEREDADWKQEIFQHQVRVAGAYLNLLAAQRIINSQLNNLQRADTFRLVVTARAKNGLIAGVDSSLANAESSAAKILLTRAKDNEQEMANRLAVLMGVPHSDFVTDSVFITRIPFIEETRDTTNEHPTLNWFRKRIEVSDAQTSYLRKLKLPVFSVFSVFQTRGSGFGANYAQDQTAFTRDYLKGIEPVRSNYLVGIGVTYNLTSPFRVSQQMASQQFISAALREEFTLADQQINAQKALAEKRIENALDNYREAPRQVRAARDAYIQRSVLYKNGLTTIVDVTQALYALNRAETDRDIAYNNVWQAFLLKAAAAGDFQMFLNALIKN